MFGKQLPSLSGHFLPILSWDRTNFFPVSRIMRREGCGIADYLLLSLFPMVADQAASLHTCPDLSPWFPYLTGHHAQRPWGGGGVLGVIYYDFACRFFIWSCDFVLVRHKSHVFFVRSVGRGFFSPGNFMFPVPVLNKTLK